MTNAAAGSSEKQRPSRCVVRGSGHEMLFALRIKARLRAGVVGAVAAEFDAIVQAVGAVVPEFEPQRRDAPAAPARRARHLADQILGGDLGDGLLKRKPAFQW